MLYSILHTIIVVVSFVQATIISAKADVTKPVHNEMPSNNSPLPTSLFTFTLTDSTGEDISSNITVLHNHRTLPSPMTRKRTASRIINQCPPTYEFAFSRCNRNINPQSYAGHCRGPPSSNPHNFRGSCYPNEFCVDTGNQLAHETIAFCISTHDFVVLARSEMEHSVAAGAAQLGIPPTSQKVYAVEVILTGRGLHQSMIAQSVRIQAVKSGIIHGRPAWLPVQGGESHCRRCASTGLSEVPDGTERFEIDVVLGAGKVVGGAMLWITAFKPGI